MSKKLIIFVFLLSLGLIFPSSIFAQSDIDDDLSYIQKLIELDNINAADIELEQFLSYNPDNSKALRLKAVVNYKNNNFTGAHEYIDRAILLDPNDVRALNNKAGFLMTEQKLDEAQILLEQSLFINPKYVSGLYNMALIFESQGKNIEVVKIYKYISEIEPDNNIVKLLLALSKETIGIVPVLGNLELSIRDSNKNLVGISKPDNMYVIDNDIVINELKRWKYFGTTIIDGHEYEIRKNAIQEIRTKDSGTGMFAQFGVKSYLQNFMLLYLNDNAVMIEVGDEVTYVFTVYVPTDRPFFEKSAQLQ